MKILGSLTSPFVRKLRVLCIEKGVPFNLQKEDPWDPASAVAGSNPLGKVPVAILDDGLELFDSSVIAEYIDTLSGPNFIPASPRDRAIVKRWEALADGLLDAGLGLFFEKRFTDSSLGETLRPRRKAQIQATLAYIAKQLQGKRYVAGDALTLGDIALASALLWLEFRMPEFTWRKDFPAIKMYVEQLETRKSFAETKPG